MDTPIFYIQTNPAFVLLPVSNDEFVFYNSIRHLACRLSKLEVLILDALYKYQSKEYILTQIVNEKNIVRDALRKIEKIGLLDTKEINFDCLDSLTQIPETLYIHLTYRCNLRCTYCYNREIRKEYSQGELLFEEWKCILDKLLPHVSSIVFTGGECFLYDKLSPIINYIRKHKPSIKLSAISNGMTDFKKEVFIDVLSNLDVINLSCDSISHEGERKGFDANIFKENVKFLRTSYPSLKLAISTTVTRFNQSELLEIEEFCCLNKCGLSNTIIVPETLDDIELLPSLECQLSYKNQDSIIETKSKFASPVVKCQAGFGVWSIDPSGNVYPCQSLNYPELKLGNIYYQSLQEIIEYRNSNFCIPSANEDPVCNRCNVKYICGGGCVASGYVLNKRRLMHNPLMCFLNRNNALLKLKGLDNRLTSI